MTQRKRQRARVALYKVTGGGSRWIRDFQTDSWTLLEFPSQPHSPTRCHWPLNLSSEERKDSPRLVGSAERDAEVLSRMGVISEAEGWKFR